VGFPFDLPIDTIMRHSTLGLLTGMLLAGASIPAESSPANVVVSRVRVVAIGGRQIFSSTQLTVSWTPVAEDQAHHVEVFAIEAMQGTSVLAMADPSVTTATLTGLKAATAYSVTVRACQDEACSTSSAADAVIGETDTEYWQLRGTGNTVNGLTKIVSDGNARLSATRFGPDAGGMANRVQLYYGPMASMRPQLAAAVSSRAADASIPDSFLAFTSRSGSSGLTSPSSPSTLIAEVATGQGVPIAQHLGGFVRLFFEAKGADNRVRIMSIDSRDGYVGLDFNRGSASTCSTQADYSAGGGCEPTVAIAVDGDAGGNRRITNARQFKVAWPTLDSPHWDMSIGTFMVFTTDRVDGCSTFQMNHGYAVWDGVRWVVQYRDNGCPKLFTSAQAAFPLHAGGARYRLYYGDPSLQDGRRAGNLPFLGPKKLIYADGAVSGSPALVDFEDWEAQTAARDVVFLWPTGEQLEAGAEGYIDDYHFLTPTGSNALQVMYITITDGAIVPIAVSAVLRNP
jgi:hypothetical protein